MKKFIAILSMLFAVSGASCAQDAPHIDVSGLSEASMNFDQEGVGPFLAGLSKTFTSGFDANAAAELTDAIDSLSVDQTGNWEYQVTVNGKPERLIVVAYKDDVDAPDLAFYSSQDLAVSIQKQLEGFAASQGW